MSFINLSALLISFSENMLITIQLIERISPKFPYICNIRRKLKYITYLKKLILTIAKTNSSRAFISSKETQSDKFETIIIFDLAPFRDSFETYFISAVAKKPTIIIGRYKQVTLFIGLSHWNTFGRRGVVTFQCWEMNEFSPVLL